jgi:hypothetical protein
MGFALEQFIEGDDHREVDDPCLFRGEEDLLGERIAVRHHTSARAF